MTDIVERLREECPMHRQTEREARITLYRVLKDAADEIERLREALALGIHMREAQTTYFKTRSKDALVAAKALEAEFLHRARALLEGER